MVWDRLPMTVAFMSIMAATVTERLSVKLGPQLLVPLVIAGARQRPLLQRPGNLWPYAAAQYYSVFLVTITIALFPPGYGRTADWFWVAGFYALAKVAEALDQPILSLTGVVSGHTLKHVVAAFAVFWLLQMLPGEPLSTRPEPDQVAKMLKPRELKTMNLSKWTVLAMTAVTLAFVGCSKNQSNVDTAPVEKSFASAEPTTKSTADKAVSAIKAGDYASALGELKALASNVKLTPEQQQAIKDVAAQVEKAIADMAAKAKGEANKAVDDLKKSLPK
jgi:hypothetical protein